MPKKFRLKDNQINGRYYGGGVVFNSKKEIREALIYNLECVNDDDEDYSKLKLWELLDIFDYEIEVKK